MTVCQHVQLIASISLSLLLTFGDGSLITWRQLYVYLHLLSHTRNNNSSFKKASAYTYFSRRTKVVLKQYFRKLTIIRCGMCDKLKQTIP